MNFTGKNIIGVSCFAVLLLTVSCTKTEDANQNNNSQASNASAIQSQAIKDDVEELGKIVRLSLAPEEATYRETGAANGEKLIAVLKFSDADAAQIVAQSEKYKQPAATEIETEDWFPAELIAQSQLSGDKTLHGLSFAADDFYQTPYTNGKLTRVGETNYFVLELNAAP